MLVSINEPLCCFSAPYAYIDSPAHYGFRASTVLFSVIGFIIQVCAYQEEEFPQPVTWNSLISIRVQVTVIAAFLNYLLIVLCFYATYRAQDLLQTLPPLQPGKIDMRLSRQRHFDIIQFTFMLCLYTVIASIMVLGISAAIYNRAYSTALAFDVILIFSTAFVTMIGIIMLYFVYSSPGKLSLWGLDLIIMLGFSSLMIGFTVYISILLTDK